MEKVKNSVIKSAFHENEFAREVFLQLNKEFSKIGILIEFSDEELSTFESFQTKLAKELELIMRSSSHRIDQLLYLSDLPEGQVQIVFEENKNPVEELAKMFLIRIAQKVDIRRQYKMGLL
ncbi:hypothetical protein CW751_11760 [Brumimicrobium salinarum]|uniref:Uncharacterized protein n=1 Tax=Brumimicrobium salinarum TaxID=2058658 RepID=A0A2I0R0E2_9FLAO|nr:hypothetical protein [Brumimicrobium salinarum]PKR80037.1 hypothetical protein CW751_11760 [Brumimicrobium salinarum]